MTPRGDYRADLQRHLRETKSHATSLQRRLEELGESRSIVAAGLGVLQSLVGQTLALGKGPFDLLRGASGEEKLLKNAKDESAAEALEIATYRALEHFASRIGDEETARLAASIRKDEERMLAALQESAHACGQGDSLGAQGRACYDLAKTGAAKAVRGAGKSAGRTTKKAAKKARSQARMPRVKRESFRASLRPRVS